MRSIDSIRHTILSHLRTNEGTVLSLTGPWGSGKTHLWNELAKQLKTEGDRVVYVSAFGLATISDLKAAIVNEGVFKYVATDGGHRSKMLSSASDLIARSLPGILQALDSKIGGPILAKNVDLVRLLPERTVVCLDDLERLSDTLKIEEVLGLANFLAEQRKVRMMLIMNDEHLAERHPNYAVLLKAYRERVVRLSLRISPDLNDIIDKLPAAAKVDPKAKLNVIEHLSMVDCRNVRTLSRALDNVANLSKLASRQLDVSHIRFITALTIEDADGTLCSEYFYNFDASLFLFTESLRGIGKEPDELEANRLAFFKRHFDRPSHEYKFIKSIFQYLLNGYVDSNELNKELDAQKTQAQTPVGLLIQDLETHQCDFFSDAEHHDWITRARTALESEASLTAMQIVWLWVGLSLSSEQTGQAIANGTEDLAEAALVRAAQIRDESSNSASKVIMRKYLSARLIKAYDDAAEKSRFDNLRQAVQEATWAGDVEKYLNLAGSEGFLGVRAALDLPVLAELHAVRVGRRRFYFEALSGLAELCHNATDIQLRDQLIAYLNVIQFQLFEVLDNSDRARLNNIEKKLFGSE